MQRIIDAYEAELKEVSDELASHEPVLERIAGLKRRKRELTRGLKKLNAPKSPTKKVVLETLLEIIQGDRPLQKGQIREEVAKRLQASGFSALGLPLRLKECLQSADFISTPEGYVRA